MKALHAGLTIVAAGLAGTASAELIDLVDPSTGMSSGWQAEIFDPGMVDLVTDFVSIRDDVVVIEKFAEFIEIDKFTGEPVPITITFKQVAGDDDTVSRIVITDEFIFNNTGQDWVDFENILVDSGNAVWNPDAMATLDISPFGSFEFLDGDTNFRVFDGVVADGDTWTPGLRSGGFVIDIDLSGDDPVIFSLKEAPSIPAPGALALLAIGGVAAVRRRR
jgi:MYXO-CTERM domain-containing protein